MKPVRDSIQNVVAANRRAKSVTTKTEKADQPDPLPRPPGYPSEDCTYADFLHWHLNVNGTRPTLKFRKWDRDDFLGIFNSLGNEATSKRYLKRWLGLDKQKPGVPQRADHTAREDYKEQIDDILFGATAALREWKDDLDLAHKRSPGAKNRRTTDWVDAAAIPRHRASGTALAIASAPTQAVLTSEIADELGLRRDLLQSLSYRFEHRNPDANDPELYEFLNRKAYEHRRLKEKLAEATELDEQLSKQMHIYLDALLASAPEKAKEALRIGEDMQKVEALKQLHIQAEFRIERGGAEIDASGDPKQAYEHFISAINLFKPFGASEQAKTRLSIVERLNSSSRIHFSEIGDLTENRAALSMRFLEDNLRSCPESAHEWATSHVRLARMLWNSISNDPYAEQDFTVSTRALELVEIAIEAFSKRHDLEDLADAHQTHANLLESFSYQLAALRDRAGEAKRYFDRSIAAREAALSIWTFEYRPKAWSRQRLELTRTLFSYACFHALPEHKEELLLKTEGVCRSTLGYPELAKHYPIGKQQKLVLARTLESLADFRTGSHRRALLSESLELFCDYFNQPIDSISSMKVIDNPTREIADVAAKLNAAAPTQKS